MVDTIHDRQLPSALVRCKSKDVDAAMLHYMPRRYFMTHYPAALTEEDVRGSKAGPLRASADDGQARVRKERARWWVRRLGMAAACAQLGTAFAATRALFTTEARQRLVDMDLRPAPHTPLHDATVSTGLGPISYAYMPAAAGAAVKAA